MTGSYFNSQASSWDAKIKENDLIRLEEMAKRLAIKRGSTVLDVGTGTGVFVPFLLKKVGSEGKLVCLDFAAEMLKKAQEKGFQGNIEYVCADISSTEFEDGMFDAAVCYSSFPHFRDKLMALQEIRRILKRSGEVFICHTSSREHINKVHHRSPETMQDLLPDAIEMQQLLSGAGFDEIKVEDETDSYWASGRKPV